MVLVEGHSAPLPFPHSECGTGPKAQMDETARLAYPLGPSATPINSLLLMMPFTAPRENSPTYAIKQHDEYFH